MAHKIPMLGKRYGMLLVLEQAQTLGRIKYLCKCDCGKEKVIFGESIRRGNSKSCGCQSVGNNFQHGFSKLKEYHAWTNMLSRCLNEKNKSYKNYGGRGIKVCERWIIFENFYKDMGSCPPKLTLERRNNDLGYNKDNCYWADRSAQNSNKRNAKLNIENINEIIKLRGLGIKVKDIAKQFNIHRGYVTTIVKRYG